MKIVNLAGINFSDIAIIDHKALDGGVAVAGAQAPSIDKEVEYIASYYRPRTDR